MAYASTSTISYLGTMAVGAMQQNSGSHPTKEIVALTRLQTAGNTCLFFTALGATLIPNSGAILNSPCNRDIVGFGASQV